MSEIFRHSFALKVRKGSLGEFLKDLGCKKKELVDLANENSLSNFSIWNADLFLFGYYESEDINPCTAKIRDIIDNGLSGADISRPLSGTSSAAIYDWISNPTRDMALMYDDYGIYREDKTMIRHRVFMTHLLTGDTAEYKRRHDAKKAERTSVNPGPDSNFTIWNGGDYIFGYDEIDTSMEHEMTDYERADTIKWEKHMLGIMEWITDDVDWITGEHHGHVKCVFHTN